MKTLEPRGSRVVIRMAPQTEKVTQSGIILPAEANPHKKQDHGFVVAVGPGSWKADGKRSGIDLNPGDCVVFNAFSMSEINLDGQILYTIDEKDIFGVVREKTDD
jgi:chaperonin GroES